MKNFICFIAILLILFVLVSCQGEIGGQGIEDSPHHPFDQHERLKGEGYGFWNQQKYSNNPIARMVTRDDRPSRGMNGFTDRSPAEMRSPNHTHPYQQKELQSIPPRSIHSKSITQTDHLESQIRQVVLENDPIAGVVVVELAEDIFVGINHHAKDAKQDSANEIKLLTSNRPIYFVYSQSELEKLNDLKQHIKIGGNPQEYFDLINDLKKGL